MLHVVGPLLDVKVLYLAVIPGSAATATSREALRDVL
jgi:hypothetical protein